MQIYQPGSNFPNFTAKILIYLLGRIPHQLELAEMRGNLAVDRFAIEIDELDPDGIVSVGQSLDDIRFPGVEVVLFPVDLEFDFRILSHVDVNGIKIDQHLFGFIAHVGPFGSAVKKGGGGDIPFVGNVAVFHFDEPGDAGFGCFQAFVVGFTEESEQVVLAIGDIKIERCLVLGGIRLAVENNVEVLSLVGIRAHQAGAVVGLGLELVRIPSDLEIEAAVFVAPRIDGSVGEFIGSVDGV